MANEEDRIKETLRLCKIECDLHIMHHCEGCIFDFGEYSCVVVSAISDD